MRRTNARFRRPRRGILVSGGAPLIFALGILAAGCGDAETREDLEGEPFLEDEPALQDERYDDAERPPTARPPAERPPTARPPAERAPAERGPAIPAGSELTFEVTETLSTSTHNEGDAFTLRLVERVSGDAGAAIPQGAQARGVVTAARSSGGPDEEAILAIRIESVETAAGFRQLNGEVVSAEPETTRGDSPQRSAAKVATGAAAGAVIGQVLGRDTRSTVAGAAAGAVAGLGVALTTRDGHATLPRGSQVTVRLAEPMIVN
jgi:hypothetical protein